METPTPVRQIEEIYNAHSEHFATWKPSERFRGIYTATVGRILGEFARERPVRLAELGCGHGTWLKQNIDLLRSQGKSCEALGIDIAEERLRLGAQYLAAYPEAKLVRGDLLEYEHSGTFDLIYVFEVFAHLPTDSQLRILARWTPRLEPGGALVVVDKDRRSLHSVLCEVQKRLGRFDFLLGPLRKFPPNFRDLVSTIVYPDFRRLKSELQKQPSLQVELVHHLEFTALVARRR